MQCNWCPSEKGKFGHREDEGGDQGDPCTSQAMTMVVTNYQELGEARDSLSQPQKEPALSILGAQKSGLQNFCGSSSSLWPLVPQPSHTSNSQRNTATKGSFSLELRPIQLQAATGCDSIIPSGTGTLIFNWSLEVRFQLPEASFGYCS